MMDRLTLALAVSAGAHLAVLAGAPLAPGQVSVSLFGARPLTARIAAAPAQEAALMEEPRLQPRVAEQKPESPAMPAQAPEKAAGLPIAEIFFRGSEVDERATPINEVTLTYPRRALVANQSGVVTLRLKIDHLGVLRDVAVVDAQPANLFEDAALAAVQALKFRPALRNGVPVGSVKTIEVPFHPDCKQTGSCIAGEEDAAGRR
jgi:periplasmic protein TonB